MTRWPSVTGEAEQLGFVACVSSFSEYVTPDCQSNLPSRRSKHITVRRPSLSLACVMKTRLPQTMGVELPRSGSGVRQRTFSLVVQCVGRPFSEQTPMPAGPRHWGQFSAEAGDTARRAINKSQACETRC